MKSTTRPYSLFALLAFAILGSPLVHAETPAPTAATVQVIRNGNFADLTDGWFLEQHATALGDLSVADDGPEGAKAARIELLEPSTEFWHLSFMQKGVKLRSDKRYRISFMAKGDQPRWIAVSLGQHLEPYKVLAANTSIEIGTAWSRVSILLRPTADEENGRFSIGNLGKTIGSLWVTNISVIEE